MAKYTTQPAFIYDFPKGDFDEVTRSHPALLWLEFYVRGKVEADKWNFIGEDVHPKAFFKTSHGHETYAADDHYAVARKLHDRFEQYYHVYDHIVVYETKEGWMSLGTAMFYYMTNEWYASDDPEKWKRAVKSPGGKEWEGVSPGAYRVHYLKDAKGKVQLGGVEIYNAYLHA